MNIDEVLALFKERYSHAGLTLETESADNLVFSRGQSKWIADSNDLAEYMQLATRFSEFEAKPTESSICSKNYCEQALIDVAPFPTLPFAGKESEILFGDRASGAPFAVFARASSLFKAYFRFKPQFFEWTTRRLGDTAMGRRKGGARIADRMFEIPVIRVENIAAASVDEAAKKANTILSGCLFQLAAIRNISHRARRQWPKARYAGQVQTRQDDIEAPLHLLKVSPIRNLVSLYTLGSGTQYPQFQFLAFYQVLEYFFVTIADERLYSTLTRRLNDLSFQCVPVQLDRIIQDVLNHRHETDEVEMLKSVLENFVDESELVAFLSDYENKTCTKQYFVKRKLFGTEVQVSSTTGHVFGTVAKTIKTIRNALVHSSDRHERSARYVPFLGDEELVAAEIPLMRFLAEKVIIASASPIT